MYMPFAICTEVDSCVHVDMWIFANIQRIFQSPLHLPPMLGLRWSRLLSGRRLLVALGSHAAQLCEHAVSSQPAPKTNPKCCPKKQNHPHPLYKKQINCKKTMYPQPLLKIPKPSTFKNPPNSLGPQWPQKNSFMLYAGPTL